MLYLDVDDVGLTRNLQVVYRCRKVQNLTDMLQEPWFSSSGLEGLSILD